MRASKRHAIKNDCGYITKSIIISFTFFQRTYNKKRVLNINFDFASVFVTYYPLTKNIGKERKNSIIHLYFNIQNV